MSDIIVLQSISDFFPDLDILPDYSWVVYVVGLLVLSIFALILAIMPGPFNKLRPIIAIILIIGYLGYLIYVGVWII